MKATIQDTIVSYQEIGNGPAVLVLHDCPSHREAAQRFAPLAEAGYRIILTGPVGVGNRVPTAAFIEEQARQAAGLLTYLGIGRAVVFGVGMGAMVLLEMLESHPDRVAASSLVIGSSAARGLRDLAGRKDIGEVLQGEGFQQIREELLATLTRSRGKASPLPARGALQGWIEGVRSRNLYLSAIHHRENLLAGLDVPPLIVESEEGAPRRREARKASLAARGWRKLRGIKAHVAALFSQLSEDDGLDEEEVFSESP